MTNDRLKKTNADIANLVSKNDRRIWTRFAVWSVLVMAFYLLMLYNSVLEYKGGFWALILLPVIPCAVFLLVGGLRLFDPAFEGRVTKVVFSVRLEASGNPRLLCSDGTTKRVGGANMRARQVNYVKFFVTDRRGKQHRYAVQLPNKRTDLGIKVGDRIRKYHGLPYPILLSNPASICPVCGNVNQKNDPVCYDCSFSVVKEA